MFQMLKQNSTGMDTPLFKFGLFVCLFFGLRQAIGNMEGTTKHKCGKFTPYSVGQVHDCLVLFATLVNFKAFC